MQLYYPEFVVYVCTYEGVNERMMTSDPLHVVLLQSPPVNTFMSLKGHMSVMFPRQNTTPRTTQEKYQASCTYDSTIAIQDTELNDFHALDLMSMIKRKTHE